MDINKEKQRLVVFSDILFQYIYFFLIHAKKSPLGDGISKKFCSNGGTSDSVLL